MENPAASGEALQSRIRFRHLSCFVAIAQERNLRRAAERLHLSQPAVSKPLGELEALSGAQLVERGRHGARLTAIKKRGVPFLPEEIRRRLKDQGETPVILVLTRHAGKAIALLCEQAEDSCRSQ